MTTPTPVDARAGVMCSNCNKPKPKPPAPLRLHCPSPTCTWWKCTGCAANNDPQGRNDKTDLSGNPKDGSARR